MDAKSTPANKTCNQGHNDPNYWIEELDDEEGYQDEEFESFPQHHCKNGDSKCLVKVGRVSDQGNYDQPKGGDNGGDNGQGKSQGQAAKNSEKNETRHLPDKYICS